MKLFKTALLVVFTCLLSLNSYSQANEIDNEEKLSLNSGTIDNQFEYVITKSNNYQEYKVIKKNWLYELKAHTLDSLKAIKTDLIAKQVVIKNQEKEILSLKTSLSNTQNNLEKTTSEKDNMALFGLQMSKTNYNSLMFFIIGVLLALLGFFIYKFSNSNIVTKKAKNDLYEIEQEFEDHRRTALEREQKVRRQLQDELNKKKK